MRALRRKGTREQIIYLFPFLKNKIVLMVWLILSFSVMCAQGVDRKKLTEEDFHLWGTLLQGDLSNDGKWVSYGMWYDEHPDTLFVKSTKKDGKQYTFGNTSSGNFGGERFFACLDKTGVLHVLDLGNGKVFQIENVKKYEFSKEWDFIITYEKKEDKNHLVFRDLKGEVLRTFTDIEGYKLNNGKDGMAVFGEQEGNFFMSLVFFDGEFNVKYEKKESTKLYHPIWSPDDTAFAYLRELKANNFSIGFYNIETNKAYELNTKNHHDFPKGYQMEGGYASGLSISMTNKRVILSIRKVDSLATSLKGTQIWKSTDALVYPELEKMGDLLFNRRMAAWEPVSNRFLKITNERLPMAMLNTDREIAIAYNYSDLGPQYRLFKKVDYYAIDLNTGKEKLIVENQSSGDFEHVLSPEGSYFAYFKDGDWWIYNFKENTTINLTKGELYSNFAGNSDETAGVDEKMYGFGGWGVNDAYVLLYDKYDVWKFGLNGEDPVRLTMGAEKEMTFRLEGGSSMDWERASNEGRISEIYDVASGVLLKSSKGPSTGYFIRKSNGNLKKIVFDDTLVNGLVGSLEDQKFFFTRQNQSTPPELVSVDLNRQITQSIYQSNTHHYDYEWGNQKIINYKDRESNNVHGILYYPASYDPKKSYPMVVSIYENQMFFKNRYINPSYYGMNGLNISSLVAQGYFVLLPTIFYEQGNPGISATECVMAATDAALAVASIDKNRLGLIGHSFGGYETNFIIGQTNRFAAAISGAGVFDYVNWYFSIGWTMGRPEMWRSETQQWRMGTSFFENKEGYLLNSPITHMDKIETPVLIWTGEYDRQIHYYQSIEFYLAMRRADKEAILLIFPKDQHALMLKEHQKELYDKINDWFGYYLKGDRPVQTWMDLNIHLR